VPAAIDQAFPALFAWLGERGIRPAGPPFIRTRAIDRSGEPLELDVAAPVEADVQVDGDVRADELPEGDYLTFLHVGPYRSETETDLGDARASLMRFADEHGIVTGRAYLVVEEAD
jgi:effector-binding domain-containing protein